MSPEIEAALATMKVVEKLEKERTDALREVDRLARENSALCDEIHDLRERLAEVGAKYALLDAAQEGKAA